MTDLEKQCMQRLDSQYAGRSVNEQELEACYNCLRQSQHTHLRLMPNHHVDEKGSLQGFLFTCSPADKASVLPIGQRMFSTTAVYEVKGERNTSFNSDAMRIISAQAASKSTLMDIVHDMRTNPCQPALFDCIGELDVSDEGYTQPKIEDQRAWAESLPAKMGIYHTFSRSYANDQREHRVFIVVSGTLVEASEQLYNLWLDCASELTCQEFVESEEARWLRTATLRALNRVAAKIAEKFDLAVHLVTDYEDPMMGRMALPSLVTRHHDMDVQTDQVRLVSSCALTDSLDSGVIFDLFSSEGYWVFQGPRNTTEYSLFGSMLAHRIDAQAFPTRTVRFNALFGAGNACNVVRVYPGGDSSMVLHEGMDSTLTADDSSLLYCEFMVPDERFYRITEQLGFNRNDGIMTLMPIVCFVSDEPVMTATE